MHQGKSHCHGHDAATQPRTSRTGSTPPSREHDIPCRLRKARSNKNITLDQMPLYISPEAEGPFVASCGHTIAAVLRLGGGSVAARLDLVTVVFEFCSVRGVETTVYCVRTPPGSNVLERAARSIESHDFRDSLTCTSSLCNLTP